MTGPGLIDRMNGYGWFLGVVINTVMLALAVSALYWKLHEEITVLKVQNAQHDSAISELKYEIKEQWRMAEREHDRLERSK